MHFLGKSSLLEGCSLLPSSLLHIRPNFFYKLQIQCLPPLYFVSILKNLCSLCSRDRSFAVAQNVDNFLDIAFIGRGNDTSSANSI